MPLFAASDSLWAGMQDAMKLFFSAGSLVVTLYFWFVRSNREKVSVAIYPVHGFEGSLEERGVGLWQGKLFLANRSILPTAIVRAKVELWWNDRWLLGNCLPGEGSESPWNLPPTQVFNKSLNAAFDLGPTTTRERVYAPHRLRFTFETVEGCTVVGEVPTHVAPSAMAA